MYGINEDNLGYTIIEVDDDELFLIRNALEHFKRTRVFSHGETDVDFVLGIINEAFSITEEYRKADNSSYLTEMERVEIAAKSPFVLESAYYN